MKVVAIPNRLIFSKHRRKMKSATRGSVTHTNKRGHSVNRLIGTPGVAATASGATTLSLRSHIHTANTSEKHKLFH